MNGLNKRIIESKMFRVFLDKIYHHTQLYYFQVQGHTCKEDNSYNCDVVVAVQTYFISAFLKPVQLQYKAIGRAITVKIT